MNSDWEDMRGASGSDRAALLVCIEKAEMHGSGFKVWVKGAGSGREHDSHQPGSHIMSRSCGSRSGMGAVYSQSMRYRIFNSQSRAEGCGPEQALSFCPFGFGM